MKNKLITKRKSITPDQFTVILEDIRSDFRAFGESLTMNNEEMKERFGNVEIALEGIKDELANINGEILDLKKLLTHKADLKRLQDLEKRVVHLEKLMVARG